MAVNTPAVYHPQQQQKKGQFCFGALEPITCTIHLQQCAGCCCCCCCTCVHLSGRSGRGIFLEKFCFFHYAICPVYTASICSMTCPSALHVALPCGIICTVVFCRGLTDKRIPLPEDPTYLIGACLQSLPRCSVCYDSVFGGSCQVSKIRFVTPFSFFLFPHQERQARIPLGL